MNERIRELADKIWAEEYWDNPNTDKLLPAQLNRFAELIIDECCVKLLDMDEKTKGNHNYYKHAAIQLKRHFRGEE
jgi:hypothetical protein